MKITANIELSNRSHAGLAGNLRKRPVYSTLAIGKASKTSDYKLLYSCKSMTLPKCYEIKDNIEKVFTKFVKEGKSTIRLKAPPEDIIISHNDPKTLMSFLTILAKVLKNEPIRTTHVIDLNDSKVPAKPKTSLVLDELKEYWDQWPRTLITLKAASLSLDDVGNKLRPLLQLQILDLSHNVLCELPEYVGNLPLATLNISHNKFTHRSNWRWMRRPCVQRSLRALNLSGNQISKLPTDLYKFKDLQDLNLSNTSIITVPPWMSSCFRSLKYLDISKNSIIYLPSAFKLLKVECLLSFSYDFLNIDTKDLPHASKETSITVPSLKSLSAAKMYPFRHSLKANMCPESMIFYVFNRNYCKCGNPVCGEQFKVNYERESVAKTLCRSESMSISIDESMPAVTVQYAVCNNETKYCRKSS